MRHVRWVVPRGSIELTTPVVVFGFSGWNDAGQAATTALSGIIETSGAELIAELDPEVFTDFASVRPEVKFDASAARFIEWPTVRIYSAKLPGADALLVVGPEPSLRWRLFTEEILEVCEHFGAELLLAMGALVADVPHTRPTPVYGVAGDATTLERFALQPSNYEGPTGIVGVIVASAREIGIPTASLWAAVPSYVAHITSPAAVHALVGRACDMIGTPAPTLDLGAEEDTFDTHLELAFEEDDDLSEYVSRLEALVDEGTADGTFDTGETPRPHIDEIDPETVLAEVEQYLRELGGDDGTDESF